MMQSYSFLLTCAKFLSFICSGAQIVNTFPAIIDKMIKYNAI